MRCVCFLFWAILGEVQLEKWKQSLCLQTLVKD